MKALLLKYWDRLRSSFRFVPAIMVCLAAALALAAVAVDEAVGDDWLESLGRIDLPPAFEREARPVGAPENGYLQLIDADALMALASEEDLLLRLERRPGHYLVEGQAMVMVWPGERLTEALVDRLNDAFVLGNQRTAGQDDEFSFRQLVAPGPAFAEMVDTAFSQIRQSARSNPVVAIRMLEAIVQIAGHIQRT